MVMAGVVATISDALATVGGAQAGYRLAMVRQHLGIDLRPGMNKIRTFAELLQAEAEEMLHSATRSSSPRFAAQDHRSGSEIDEWAWRSAKRLSKGRVRTR